MRLEMRGPAGPDIISTIPPDYSPEDRPDYLKPDNIRTKTESKEYRGELEAAVNRIRGIFIERLHERHDNKPFHGPDHSLTLEKNGVRDLTAIQAIDPGLVTTEDILIFRPEALSHDSVINEIPPAQNRPGLDTIKRQRGFTDADIPSDAAGDKLYPGGNERLSASELITAMEAEPILKALLEARPDLKQEIYADIGTTYPAVSFEANGLRFSQPYSRPETSIRGFILAQNDLRGAYRADADQNRIVIEGNGEWWELNRPVTDRIYQAAAEVARQPGLSLEAAVVEQFNQKERQDVLKSILGWKRMQPSHVRFQQEEFEKTLHTHNGIANSPHADEITSLLEETYNSKGPGKNSFNRAAELTSQLNDEYQATYGSILADPEAPQTIDDETFLKLLRSMGGIK